MELKQVNKSLIDSNQFPALVLLGTGASFGTTRRRFEASVSNRVWELDIGYGV